MPATACRQRSHNAIAGMARSYGRGVTVADRGFGFVRARRFGFSRTCGFRFSRTSASE